VVAWTDIFAKFFLHLSITEIVEVVSYNKNMRSSKCFVTLVLLAGHQKRGNISGKN
jgi:hypothetical protein